MFLDHADLPPVMEPVIKLGLAYFDLAPKSDPLGCLGNKVFQRGLAPAEKIANSAGDWSPKALWGRTAL
jgi:hypothetical protein